MSDAEDVHQSGSVDERSHGAGADCRKRLKMRGQKRFAPVTALDYKSRANRARGGLIAKAYWISAYRSVSDPAKVAAYAELARPAILAGGGRFLARGGRIEAHEAGIAGRTVIIEFDSFAQATAAYASEAYQKALVVLADGAERDVRIVEGVD